MFAAAVMNPPAGSAVAWPGTMESPIPTSNVPVMMGDSMVPGQATALPAGGFITAAANMHHYAIARGHTVVQVHAMGPFALTYVRPKDDPRNAASAR